MKICYLNGAESGKMVEVPPASGLTIGRETDNDIQLLVGGVSRYHAKMEFDGQRWVLRDLGSTNGTKLNGIAIVEPMRVTGGDVIAVGDQHFKLIDGNLDNPTAVINGPAAASRQTIPVPEPAPAFVFRPDMDPPQAPPPPLEKTVVAEQPKPEAGNFFGDGKNDFFKKEDDKAAGATKNKSSLKGNLIFALVLVIMLAGGGIAIKKMMSEDVNAGRNRAGTDKNTQTIHNPFFFYCERQVVDNKTKNIFKYKIHGELGFDDRVTTKDKDGNTKPEKRFFVTMTVDDLANGRHFFKRFGVDEEIPEAKIQQLQKGIERSGFMTISQEQSDFESGNQDYERIVIGYDDKLKDVIFYNEDGESNTYFKSAMELLRQFVEEDVSPAHGISIMNTSEEILLLAQRAFNEAQRADENHENDPADLPRALAAYKRAEQLYMQFRKKPDEYDVVVERLAKLRKIHREKYSDGVRRIMQFQEIGDLSRAIQECETYMEYFPAGSSEYEKLRNHKLKIEAHRRKTLEGK